MPTPKMTPRWYALEKRRRLREGVFFYLHDIKRLNPEIDFTDDLMIKNYIRRFKSKISMKMAEEQETIKKLGLQIYFLRWKKRNISWEIESQFIGKKKLIWELTEIKKEDLDVSLPS